MALFIISIYSAVYREPLFIIPSPEIPLITALILLIAPQSRTEEKIPPFHHIDYLPSSFFLESILPRVHNLPVPTLQRVYALSEYAGENSKTKGLG